ncbi:unnamed protein product [Nyctereutes procyonoides]|uniref:(raccoon dog) hypothetical protein n=1 Tax=Nyctereutes procyonoides TaxID=34880 RepID=A0A811Z8V4_NYCPR|nr:unnamed protein product [Nyctereutes procyonoides]
MQLEQEEKCGLTGQYSYLILGSSPNMCVLILTLPRHSVAARNHRSPLCTSPPKSTLSLHRCCQRPCLNTMPKQPVQKEHLVNLACQKAKKEDICSIEFMVTRPHVVNSHHNKNVSISPPPPRSSSYLHNHCGKFTWKPGGPEPVDIMHFCQPPRTQKTLEEWKLCFFISKKRGGEVGVEGGTVKSWMQKDFGKCQAFV